MDTLQQGGGAGRLQVWIAESIIDDRVAFKNGGGQTATSEEGILIFKLDLVSVSQTEKVSLTRLAEVEYLDELKQGAKVIPIGRADD